MILGWNPLQLVLEPAPHFRPGNKLQQLANLRRRRGFGCLRPSPTEVSIIKLKRAVAIRPLIRCGRAKAEPSAPRVKSR